jgi:hypothetical protein
MLMKARPDENGFPRALEPLELALVPEVTVNVFEAPQPPPEPNWIMPLVIAAVPVLLTEAFKRISRSSRN